MAQALTLITSISGAITEALEAGTRTYNVSKKFTQSLADGTGLNQANKFFQDTVTLAGSAVQSYDLDSALAQAAVSGGGGIFGTVTFARIVAIAIKAAVANNDNLNVAGDWVLTKLLGGVVDDVVVYPIRPGGLLLLTAPAATGIVVTATTGDVLSITNADAAVNATFEILIIGS